MGASREAACMKRWGGYSHNLSPVRLLPSNFAHNLVYWLNFSLVSFISLAIVGDVEQSSFSSSSSLFSYVWICSNKCMRVTESSIEFTLSVRFRRRNLATHDEAPPEDDKRSGDMKLVIPEKHALQLPKHERPQDRAGTTMKIYNKICTV